MGKFDTWSIVCKMCDWEWETCSPVFAKNPKCPQCGSTHCDVEKNEFITIKKQGKIIADIETEKIWEEPGILDGDKIVKTTKTEKPLLILKRDDYKFAESLTDEEKKELLDELDIVKLKLIRDIIDSK